MLDNLGSSAEVQRRYLRDLGSAPSADELALEWDDLYLVAKSALPQHVRPKLDELDRVLHAMSDAHPDLWNVDALDAAPEWQAVRSLARELRQAVAKFR